MLGFVRLMEGRGDVAVLSTEVGDQMQVKVATAERKRSKSFTLHCINPAKIFQQPSWWLSCLTQIRQRKKLSRTQLWLYLGLMQEEHVQLFPVPHNIPKGLKIFRKEIWRKKNMAICIGDLLAYWLWRILTFCWPSDLEFFISQDVPASEGGWHGAWSADH